MADRDAIVAFADDLLEAGEFRDALPTGLQLPGAPDVRLVVSGVTASLELFARAADAGAQMVLVHHGLFWERDPRAIGAVMRERLRALFDHDLSLVAYHLALDAHPEIGNNANVARQLGIEDRKRFTEWGWGGRIPQALSIADFSHRVQDVMGRMPLVFPYGPEEVERVAVLTGGAARYVATAVEEGYDLFLTGEAAEPTKHAAKEAGIHFVAAGHYATETSGVQALAQRIADQFEVQWEFVDLPNPV